MFPREFAIGLARAAAGALLFSLPMLLTMEMWWIGCTMQPVRILTLLAVMVPILIGLAFYSGFEEQVSLLGATVDAFVAYAVAALVCVVILCVRAILRPHEMNIDEIAGKIILQTIAASVGAVLAASQMGADESEGRERDDDPQPDDSGHASANSHNNWACYLRELFLMLAGAIFLALNVAPTDEMILVALKMTAWHGIMLLILSILIMHGFIFTVRFHGHEKPAGEHSVTSVFFRFTVPGYAIALLVSLFCLWMFGRLDHNAFDESILAATVLGMPAAVGAAAARLIL